MILIRGDDVKGAIFDVDGTLLDSMTVWLHITDNFFQANGLILSDEKAEQYREMTIEESMSSIKEEFGSEMSLEKVEEEIQRLAAIEYENNIELKPYAKEYIEKLHADGVKIAIATSGYPHLCKAAFKRLGIEQYIDIYAFSSEVGVNKSNPDIYLLAAKRLGLEPEDCVVFEDISLGISGAKKAGCKTCAIYDDTNARYTDELKQISDHYITGWKDLL